MWSGDFCIYKAITHHTTFDQVRYVEKRAIRGSKTYYVPSEKSSSEKKKLKSLRNLVMNKDVRVPEDDKSFLENSHKMPTSPPQNNIIAIKKQGARGGYFG